MREQRDPHLRMPYRLWYDEAEIDAIMEVELRKSGTARLTEGGRRRRRVLSGARTGLR